MATIARLLFCHATTSGAHDPLSDATAVSCADRGRDGLVRSLPSVSILAANYTGTLNERVAQLDATIVVSAARPDQKIPLFSDEVAIERFSAKPAGAKLVREGNTVSVLLPRRGEVTLQ